MMKICLARLVFWTLVSLLPALGTALVIDIKPEKLTESMKGNVDIKCRVDTRDVEQIISFGISKDKGPQLAYMKEDGPPSYNAAKYHAVGSVNYDVRKSYLKLSILHPGQSDQGEYTCKLDFMNKRGDTQVRTVSSKLDVDDLDIPQLVLSMKKEISYLMEQDKKVSSKQQEAIVGTDELGNHLVKRLYSRHVNMRRLVSSMKKKISYLMEQDKKEQMTCFFNAKHKDWNSRMQFYRGTLVFDKVVAMHGGGYDSSTGIFTAPVHGLYAFNFQFMINCGDCTIQIKLHHGEKIMAYAYVTDHLYGTSSGSCVIEMKLGETADVRQTHGDGAIRYSAFSGYLVKELY